MINEKGKKFNNHIMDNKTQPVFDYKECIFEKVYVETPVDTDGDGKLDLIAVYIRRPKETLEGLKVPAIYVANPYMMTCNEDWYKLHEVDKDIKIYEEKDIKERDITYRKDQDNLNELRVHRETKGYADTAITQEIPLDCISDWYSYFNSRGYASVFCGGLGTKGSEGFTITGSVEEREAFKAVIDWLNGRCRAFTNREDNIEIKANWCTGNVAMSGKSYLGTMCIGVVATGVEGLKTIIPEAAISNWYEYYRYNGLNCAAMEWQGDDIDLLSKYCFSRSMDEDYLEVKEDYEKAIEDMKKAQDRDSGNYNKFWDERNYLKLIENVKASVFIVHGLNDWNVKTSHFHSFWNALEKINVPKKMMLHQGDHIYIHDLHSGNFNDILHKWLDYWLYGIENGALEEIPNVMIQSNVNQDLWQTSNNWPPENSKSIKFNIPKGEEVITFEDDLSATCYHREQGNMKEWLEELILDNSGQRNHFIRFLGEPLKEAIRITDRVNVTFKAALDKPTAVLSAMIVDYGDDNRILTKQEVVKDKEIQWGLNTPKANIKRFSIEETPSSYRVISRGWINAQNRTCNWKKEKLEEEKYYEYNFSMIPMDYTVKPGHRIGVIIYGSDVEFTQRQHRKTKVMVKRDSIDVELKILRGCRTK